VTTMAEDERDDTGGTEEIHEYRAAGIRERTGRVPLWLWAVAAGLLAWGAYYIVQNWAPPP